MRQSIRGQKILHLSQIFANYITANVVFCSYLWTHVHVDTIIKLYTVTTYDILMFGESIPLAVLDVTELGFLIKIRRCFFAVSVNFQSD